VAPEVLRFEYGPESDVWSVGVIAYLLLTGHVPYDGPTEKAILLRVLRCARRSLNPHRCWQGLESGGDWSLWHPASMTQAPAEG
jgi:serine/threonine protein kinase